MTVATRHGHLTRANNGNRLRNVVEDAALMGACAILEDVFGGMRRERRTTEHWCRVSTTTTSGCNTGVT